MCDTIANTVPNCLPAAIVIDGANERTNKQQQQVSEKNNEEQKNAHKQLNSTTMWLEQYQHNIIMGDNIAR